MIKVGDLVLSNSQVANGFFFPKQVLGIEVKHKVLMISVADEVWVPAENFVLAKDAIGKIILMATHDFDHANSMAKRYSEILVKLKKTEKDLNDSSVPAECILHGHDEKVESGITEGALPEPFTKIICKRCGKVLNSS